MATRSTDIKVNILGDYDSLRKTITKSIGQVDRFDKSVKKSGRTTFRDFGKAAFGAAAGIGAIAIAGNEVKKSISGTVDLAKATRQLQRATGLAAEDASALAAVLKVRGFDTNKLGRSFTSLARQIEAAKTGTGSAADAFAKLGVSQRAIQSGNFNQVLLGIADGFNKLGDGTSKASVAQQLFGRNSRDLIPLLEGGSAKLREQLALAPQLSDAQVKQGLAMVNAQRQVDLALMNVRTTLGTTLLPVLADGANKLAKFVTEMKTGKGEGGQFARQMRDLWSQIGPVVKQLADAAKAAFEFAAANPKLVRLAATLAAVGLAIKTVKFVSAVSGLTTFLNTAKGLGGPLRKLFERFGTRAGTAFAGEAAGSMAGGMGTALAPTGPIGKFGGKNGRFAKWGRLAGRATGAALAGGIIAGIIAYGPELARKLNDWFSQNVPGFLKGILGIRGSQDPRSQYFGMDRNPFSGGAPKKRSGPSARGSAMLRAGGRAAQRLVPNLNPTRGSIYDLRGMDPLTGGIPVEALLQRAEGKASSAQYRVDRFQATIGDKRSKSETRRLKELTAAARQAQREVNKLQKQMSRRDALLEIRGAFREFAQGFTDAYAQGLQNIADARLQASQNLADKALQSQLKNLDEEEGQTEEARRIRELREQQERDQREREDKDFNDNKLALETQLERAIRNGNLRGQQELRQQLEDLDQQRRDLLRNREITDLSESLQRQRKAAQDDYEARVGAAQDYYDKQLDLNKKAVDEYRKVTEDQLKALTDQLEAGVINYGTFNERVTALAGVLTTNLQTDLNNRATAERDSLAASLGRYGTFVGDVNAAFSQVMRVLPQPAIPPIPEISVDAVLKIQRIDGLPSGVTVGGGGGGGASTPAPVKTFSFEEIYKDLSGKSFKGTTLAKSFLRSRFGLTDAQLTSVLNNASMKKLLSKQKIKIKNMASGGRLSRSGLTMVGETGPEMIVNGQVMSATRSARTGGAGVTLNVYPRTTADDPVALARALGWQLATR